jgi:site-specific DNA-cytosine methylase
MSKKQKYTFIDLFAGAGGLSEGFIKAGYEALKNYRRDFDEDRKCFKDTPLHDWTSHGADAFRMIPIVERTKVKQVKEFEPVKWSGGGW